MKLNYNKTQSTDNISNRDNVSESKQFLETESDNTKFNSGTIEDEFEISTTTTTRGKLPPSLQNEFANHAKRIAVIEFEKMKNEKLQEFREEMNAIANSQTIISQSEIEHYVHTVLDSNQKIKEFSISSFNGKTELVISHNFERVGLAISNLRDYLNKIEEKFPNNYFEFRYKKSQN